MPELGINIGRDLSIPPAEVADTGARWVRFPLTPYVDARPYIDSLREFGIRSELIVDSLTMEGIDWANASDDDAYAYGLQQMQTYAFYYASYADKWQIGNEPDGPEYSSWPMSGSKFGLLLRVGREALPDAEIIAGGLVSGDPSYLNDVDLGPVNGISLHPYGQGLPDFPSPYGISGHIYELADRYWPYKPTYMEFSEFGVNHEHFDQDFAAEYVNRMLTALKDMGQTNYFCHTDQMVPSFGLKDWDGNNRLAYYEFQRLAGAEEPALVASIAGISPLEVARGAGRLRSRRRKSEIIIPKSPYPQTSVSARYSLSA